jgi:hypothetical protein
MGFITLGSGHVVHASLLPNLNPPGSIEAWGWDSSTGEWYCLVPSQKSVSADELPEPPKNSGV